MLLIAEDLYPSPDLVIPTHSTWARKNYPRRISQFKKHPLKQGDIVFLGDSITQQGGNWSVKFDEPMVKNRGISGDVTEGVRLRLNEVIHAKPRAVFLLIGINDLLRAGKSPDYIAENIIRITDLIRKNSPTTRIYVQTLLPVAVTKGHLEEIQAVNRKLASYPNQNFTLLDLYSHFADESGYLRNTLSKDGLHLSPAGYNLWVDLVKKYVKGAAAR